MRDIWLVVDALLQVKKKKLLMISVTSHLSLGFSLWALIYNVSVEQKAKSEWGGGGGIEMENRN